MDDEYTVIDVATARKRMGELLDLASNGATVIIRRRGAAAACLVRPDAEALKHFREHIVAELEAEHGVGDE